MNTKKDRKKILKKILCFSGVFIICLFSFLPSFATSTNNIDFSAQPIPYSSYIDPSTCLLLGHSSSNGNAYGCTPTEGVDVYVFYWSGYGPVFCSENVSTVALYGFNNTNNYQTLTLNTFDSTYELYYGYTTFRTYFDATYIPIYSDLASGFSDVINYIDNSNPSLQPVSYTSHISLEPGCVLYIGSTSNNTVTINGTTCFPMRSTLIGGDFPDSSQTYAVVSSLPSNGTTFPLQYAVRLPWVKDQPYNVLGQSFNAKIENFVINTQNQSFIAIHNPYFVNVEDFNAAGDLNTNNTLELDITGYNSLRIYPLQDEVLDSTSPDNFNAYWVGNSSDNGDGTGNVTWDPVSEDGSDVSNMGSNPNNMGINGGGNFDSTSILQQIKQTLDNFVSSFISVISAPISHIAELINAGSGFMSALRGLYAWLPVDIQSLVISALTLVIGIGVFKVFL